MIAIEKQLSELMNQKNALVNVLKNNGVSVSENETFNTLIPKINELSGGGLNIHFDDTPPEDTSMLWLKCDEASKITISPNTVLPRVEQFSTLTQTISNLYDNTYVCGVGNILYIITCGKYNYARFYAFDTVNESITQLSVTLPVAIIDMGIGVVGTDIYFFGGCDSNTTYYDTIYKFDTLSETITQLSITLRCPMRRPNIGVVGNDIWIFEGRVDSSDARSGLQFCIFDTAENKTYYYGASGSSISEFTNKRDMFIGIYKNNIYVFGGYDGNSTYYDTIWKFDTLKVKELHNDSWTSYVEKLPITLPFPFMNISTCQPVTSETDIYLLNPYNGGYDNCILKFNALDETVELLATKLPHTDTYKGYDIVNSNIYVCGGSRYYYKETGKYIDKFDVNIKLNNNNLLIQPSTDAKTFNILGDGNYLETKIRNAYKGNGDNVGEEVEAYLYQDGEWTLI